LLEDNAWLRTKIEREIVFVHLDVAACGLNAEAACVRDLAIKPHGVEGPIGSQLKHGGDKWQRLEHLHEQSLLLGLVDAAVGSHQIAKPLAIVAKLVNSKAIVHGELTIFRFAGFLYSRYVSIVRAG
jgi:hypothetical protein